MPAINDAINEVAAHIISTYDNGRFADLLQVDVDHSRPAKEYLAGMLLEAGAGPALIMVAAMSDLTGEQLSEQLAGIQGQFEAVGALVDWRRSGLDDLQSLSREVGDAPHSQALHQIVQTLAPRLDHFNSGQVQGRPENFSTVLAALTLEVLKIASATGVNLREALVNHMASAHDRPTA